mgnify:CR=1 FL=1
MKLILIHPQLGVELVHEAVNGFALKFVVCVWPQLNDVGRASID